jgi:hypothetical protein
MACKVGDDEDEYVAIRQAPQRKSAGGGERRGRSSSGLRALPVGPAEHPL